MSHSLDSLSSGLQKAWAVLLLHSVILCIHSLSPGIRLAPLHPCHCPWLPSHGLGITSMLRYIWEALKHYQVQMPAWDASISCSQPHILCIDPEETLPRRFHVSNFNLLLMAAYSLVHQVIYPTSFVTGKQKFHLHCVTWMVLIDSLLPSKTLQAKVSIICISLNIP